MSGGHAVKDKVMPQDGHGQLPLCEIGMIQEIQRQQRQEFSLCPQEDWRQL